MAKPINAEAPRAGARFASAVILLAAARCMRVGYKHWQTLDSFGVRDVAVILSLYTLAFALVLVALDDPPARVTSMLDGAMQRWRTSASAAVRRRMMATFAIVTTFAAPSVTALVLLRPIVSSYHSDTIGSDGLLFAQRAVESILASENPYATSMAESFREHPEIVPTYRIDGSRVVELSYPALSFLAFLPQRLLGIENLNLTPLVVLLATMLWLVIRAPLELKWFPLLLLWADWSIAAFSAGGVFDILWVLPLLAAMSCFYSDKLGIAGAWFGVACCVKQTPWFIAPFMVLALWSRSQATELRRRNALRFVGAAIATFIFSNLPFIVENPGAWLRGVFTPIAGGVPLVPFGTGPVLLELAGIITEPKSFFSLGMFLCLGLTAMAYVEHRGRVEGLPWVAPMVVLWFNFRSPHNYYAFFTLVAFHVILLRTRSMALTQRQKPRRLLVAAAMCALTWIIAAIGWRHATALATELTVIAADDPDELGRVSEIAVRLVNQGNGSISPIFAVHSSMHATPVFWPADGPTSLASGASATFALSAPVSVGALQDNGPARLVVYDSGTERHAGSTFQPSELAPKTNQAVSNPRFTRCARAGERLELPFLWNAVRSLNGSASAECTQGGLVLTVRGGGSLALTQLTRKRLRRITVDATPMLIGANDADLSGVELHTTTYCVALRFVASSTKRVDDTTIDGRECKVVGLPVQEGARARVKIDLNDVNDKAFNDALTSDTGEVHVEVFVRGSAQVAIHELLGSP